MDLQARTVGGRWEVLCETSVESQGSSVELSMLTKQVIQITSEFFAHEIIRSMKMYEVFKFK